MEPTLNAPIVSETAVETVTQVVTDAVAHNNLTGIAIVVVAALLCGLGMERLRQPAILGYMVAGVLLGPSALGLVRDQGQIGVLAELGVLMLLFVIGMELSLRIFKHIWRLAVAAAALQIGAALAVFWLLAFAFDWPASVAVLMGFVVAMSSTAVAIKILQDAGELKTRAGRIAVAVLIAQDQARRAGRAGGGGAVFRRGGDFRPAGVERRLWRVRRRAGDRQLELENPSLS